jgi:hypothetical protein
MTDFLGGTIRRNGDFAEIRIPMSEVHSLRVALQPCPCKGSKSVATASIREALDKGLGRLQARPMHRP